MNWSRNLVVLLVLALVFTLIGGAGIAQGQAVRNPNTLVYVQFGEAASMDPAWAYDDASFTAMLWSVYETLIFFRGGSTGEYEPMLATQVPTMANGGISADGRTYRFTIRSGVRFHDGSTMTPADVKYSLLRFMFTDRPGGASWILLAPVLGVDGTRDDDGKLNAALFTQADRAIQVSGNTVSITLKDPYAPFMSIAAQWTVVVPRAFASAQGGWNGTAATLAALNNPQKPEDTSLFSRGSGTGPFRLASWDRSNRQVILERNNNYWRAPARIQRVVIRTVDDFGARRLMLQQGDADIVSVNRTELPQVQGIAGVRVVDDLPTLANVGMFINLRIDTSGGNPDVGSGRLDGNGIPPDFFADVNIRRALAQAFDYNTAIRDCYRGKAAVGHGPIPKGMFGYNPNQRWYTFDRERATAAFREARGGQVWNTGFRFTVLHNEGNTVRQCLAQVLKSGVEGLNPKFRVDVRAMTWPQYLQAYRQKKLPVYFIGWGADYPDAENFVTPYLHSTGTFSAAQSYNNPEADRLIAQTRTETDTAKRRAAFYRLQEIAYNDVPTINLDPVSFVVLRSWVRGWYWNPAFLTNYYWYTLSKGQQ